MIRRVTFKNFRGQSRTVDLAQHTRLEGPNEAGKTTIGHAIAFVFTGRDLAGTVAPTHLISRGEDSMKVEIETDKSVIKRSLTAKKNGSLYVVMHGKSTKVDPTQFTKMVAPPDVFLSIFSAGYFPSLSKSKKAEVLNHLMPKFNTANLVKDLSGIALSEEEIDQYKIHRRPELVATSIAQVRRSLQSLKDQLQGAIQSQQVPEDRPRPNPPQVESIGRLRQLAREWETYYERLKAFEQSEGQLAGWESARQLAKSKENALRREINDFRKDWREVTDGVDHREKIRELESKIRRDPPEPAQMRLPSSEHCPTCGQIVGLKQREKVDTENERAVAAWSEEVKANRDHNVKIEEEIKKLREEEAASRTLAYENNKRNREIDLEVRRREHEIEQLARNALARPQEVPRPVEPSQRFDPQVLDQAERAMAAYEREIAVWEYEQKQRREMEASRREWESVEKELDPQINRATLLETAFKELPAEILKRQQDLLSFSGFTFVTEGNDVRVVRDDGMPLSLLSRGKYMEVCALICRKLDSFRQAPQEKPLDILFMDNAEAVTSTMSFLYDEPNLQSFLAVASPTLTELTITTR